MNISWLLILSGGITDILDGWFARRSYKKSVLGSRLDPLADKLLLLAPLIWLTKNNILPIWAVWLLIVRELIISLWRSSEASGGPSSFNGKLKTILQFISVLLMLWPSSWGGISISLMLQQIGWYLFWPSLYLALYSSFSYLRSQLN